MLPVEIRGFPMGIQSYSLRGFGVDGALDKIQELELHHVEFFRMHFLRHLTVRSKQ